MDKVSSLIRVSIPNYFAGLPIPDTFSGWFKLGIPFGAAVTGISFLAYNQISTSGIPCLKMCSKKCAKGAKVNESIKKDNPKVVDMVDIEDIGEKKVYCRCWRSASFPYCDGSHAKHNEATGDNVGPLIVKKKSD